TDLRAGEIVDGGLDHPTRLVPFEQHWDGTQHDAPASEAVQCESEALERAAPALDEGEPGRRQVERLGKEQRLRRERPLGEMRLQALEQHSLVRHVLIEEED